MSSEKMTRGDLPVAPTNNYSSNSRFLKHVLHRFFDRLYRNDL